MDQKSQSKSQQQKLNRYDASALFGNTFMEEIHAGKLFINLFQQYFSRYIISQATNHEGLFQHIIKKYSVSYNQIIRVDFAQEENLFEIENGESEIWIILKKCLMLMIKHDRIKIMYSPSISISERNDLIETINKFKIEKPNKRFYMIENSGGCFGLIDFDIKQIELDVQTHYNDDFIDINDLVIKSLNAKNKSGLFLFHGKYGTGKTSYLRYLISTIDRRFIYFPIKMIEAINSPEFLPFITRHPNAVLILEDCESLLVQREIGFDNASSLSNLLNLSDGLLGDALSINAICTFNAGIRKIDEAILRKGRLLARYEFTELEIEKAQHLADSIGKQVKVNKPMTVADIYNIDAKTFDNVTKSIGFKAA